MNKFLFLLSVFIILETAASKVSADDHIPLSCVRMAEKMKLVTVNYNYGELRLDASKNTAEVSEMCHDRAAGCFHNSSGTIGNVSVSKVDVGSSCQAYHITVDYDFSGRVIYVTNEYNPCNTRAVLRHELQHFMNWKTSKEQLIRETKIALKRWSIENMEQINSDASNSRIYALREVYKIINRLMEKWFKVNEENDRMLDDTDHDKQTEVNYSVCAPYELQFK